MPRKPSSASTYYLRGILVATSPLIQSTGCAHIVAFDRIRIENDTALLVPGLRGHQRFCCRTRDAIYTLYQPTEKHSPLNGPKSVMLTVPTDGNLQLHRACYPEYVRGGSYLRIQHDTILTYLSKVSGEQRPKSESTYVGVPASDA